MDYIDSSHHEEGSINPDLAVVRRALGLPGERTYLPEGDAPPVDERLVEALARHDLSKEEFHRVTDLTALYRSWSEAYSRALLKVIGEGDASTEELGRD